MDPCSVVLPRTIEALDPLVIAMPPCLANPYRMINLIVLRYFPSQIKDQLPHLKAIVQYKDELQQKLPNLYTVHLQKC